MALCLRIIAYQILKEDDQAEVPPYSVQPTPQGYMHVPVVKENNTVRHSKPP